MNDTKRAEELELVLKAVVKDADKLHEIAKETLRLTSGLARHRRNLTALEKKL